MAQGACEVRSVHLIDPNPIHCSRLRPPYTTALSGPRVGPRPAGAPVTAHSSSAFAAAVPFGHNRHGQPLRLANHEARRRRAGCIGRGPISPRWFQRTGPPTGWSPSPRAREAKRVLKSSSRARAARPILPGMIAAMTELASVGRAGALRGAQRSSIRFCPSCRCPAACP